MTSTHKLRWSHGDATIVSTSAMLTDATFILPNGPFKPFARAPWVGTVSDPAIVGHLRVLAGDFVGLPFGTGGRQAPTLPEWSALMTQPPDAPRVRTTSLGPRSSNMAALVSGAPVYPRCVRSSSLTFTTSAQPIIESAASR